MSARVWVFELDELVSTDFRGEIARSQFNDAAKHAKLSSREDKRHCRDCARDEELTLGIQRHRHSIHRSVFDGRIRSSSRGCESKLDGEVECVKSVWKVILT